MPARTNSYQQLILAINRMLSSRAAKIEESKMLWDEKSEQNREIDIYIEDNVGPYKVSIGVECTAKKYKLDVRAVEQLIAKHESLGINRTVIVSTHGFTEPAKRYATKKGAEVLTFSAALRKNWPAMLEKHKTKYVVAQKVTCLGGRIFVEKEDLESGFDPTATPLQVEVDGVRKHMEDFAIEQLGGVSLLPPARLSLNAEVLEQTEEVVERSIPYNPPITVFNKKGDSAKISQLTFRYRVQRKVTPIELSHGTYAGKAVAHGEASNLGFDQEPFQNASVVLTESDSGHPNMYFEFRAKET